MKYGEMKYNKTNNELPAYSRNALHKTEMEPDVLLEMIRKEKVLEMKLKKRAHGCARIFLMCALLVQLCLPTLTVGRFAVQFS